MQGTENPNNSDWIKKQRFALFSYPPTSVGVNPILQKTKHVDANGKVPLTEPKFLTGTGLKSNSYSGLFTKPVFLEPNLELIKRDAALEKLNKSQQLGNKKPFNRTKSEFDHVPVPEARKTGNEGFGPKGIYTAAPKKGHLNATIRHLFEKKFEYTPSPYNLEKELERKAFEESKSKMMSKPFRSNFHGDQLFTSMKELTQKPDLPNLPPKNNQSGKSDNGIHKEPFKPTNLAKQGYNKTLNPYPEYISDPYQGSGSKALPKEVRERLEKEKPKPWGYIHKDLTQPSPSIEKYNKTYRPTFFGGTQLVS